MKILVLFTLLAITFSGMSQTMESFEYKIDGESFTGYYAKPSKINSKTKTILIVHEWWGLNEYPKSRAKKIAEEGNIGICIDMFGTGKLADNPTDAQALATPFYMDQQLAYNRFMAGYNEAIKIDGVDPNKIAAIGYCFGGSMVLNAACMGAPLDAVVSFHGGLAGIPGKNSKLTAVVLVCNGGADPFVPAEEISAFKTGMTAINANYTFIDYAGATHAFTNPMSTDVGKKFNIPIAYNEPADKKSWADYQKFIKTNVK